MSSRGPRWGYSVPHPILHDFEWNEAEGPTSDWAHEGFVALVAWTPDRAIRLIGSGFVISACNDHALLVTAAHNLSYAHQVQLGPRRAHPTALPEFLPAEAPLSLDRRHLRALYRKGTHVEACIVTFAAWDEWADVGILKIIPEASKDEPFFQREMGLAHEAPAIGDIMGLIGYADMAVQSQQQDDQGNEQGQL
jgi:S1-C subfamily serine protease